MTLQYLILAALFLVSSVSPASADPLTPASDWHQLAQQAQQAHTPILVLYTAEACGYCERLKQDVLNPMLRQDRTAIIREVDIHAGGKMTDFDGERIRTRQFKDRYQVFATPTLLILDPQGEPGASPIVGYSSKEAYRSLLDERLQAYRLTRN